MITCHSSNHWYNNIIKMCKKYSRFIITRYADSHTASMNWLKNSFVSLKTLGSFTTKYQKDIFYPEVLKKLQVKIGKVYTLGFLLGGSWRLNFGMSLEGAYGILFEDTFLPIVSI